MADYPEHEKLRAISDKSQSIGEFLEWASDKKNAVLATTHYHSGKCYDEDGDRECGFSNGELICLHIPVQDLLAEFFGIDRDKLESEKE